MKKRYFWASAIALVLVGLTLSMSSTAAGSGWMQMTMTPMAGHGGHPPQTPPTTQFQATGVQGTIWVANEAGNSLTVIDADRHQVITTLTGLAGAHNVQVSPDGNSVWAVSGHDSVVVKIDARTYSVVGSVPTGSHPAHVILSPDGQWAYVTNSEDNSLTIIDAESLAVVATIPVGAFPHGLRSSPDGRWLYIANLQEGSVSVVDTQANEVATTIPVGDAPVQVGVAPDGTLVYVSLNGENALAKIDALTQTLIAKVEVGRGPAQVYVTPDNRFVLVANQGTSAQPSATVSIVEVESFTVVATIETGSGAHGIVVEPMGRYAYITNQFENTVAVIDLDEQTRIATIPTGIAPNGISFSLVLPMVAASDQMALALESAGDATGHGAHHGGGMMPTTPAGAMGQCMDGTDHAARMAEMQAMMATMMPMEMSPEMHGMMSAMNGMMGMMQGRETCDGMMMGMMGQMQGMMAMMMGMDMSPEMQAMMEEMQAMMATMHGDSAPASAPSDHSAHHAAIAGHIEALLALELSPDMEAALHIMETLVNTMQGPSVTDTLMMDLHGQLQGMVDLMMAMEMSEEVHTHLLDLQATLTSIHESNMAGTTDHSAHHGGASTATPAPTDHTDHNAAPPTDHSQHTTTDTTDHSAHHGPISSVGVPVASQTTGGQPLDYRLEDGVKVFELTAQPVLWSIHDDVQVTAWTYNGTVPGPMIRVTEGDMVRIIFKNELPEATTIHWHGVQVPIEMDGVPGVSQDPVEPGETFVYEFVAKPAGTFMYHSHHNSDTQIGLGLYAPFIIDPAVPTTPAPDVDYSLMLNEVRVVGGVTYPAMPMSAMEPNYFTFNGKVFPNTENLEVKVGQRVRIRIYNVGQFVHPIHLHGMSFRVVAIDGAVVPEDQQLSIDTVSVAPGQRFDIEFVPTAVGQWMLHCHISHHTVNGDLPGHGGMMMTVNVTESVAP